MKKELRFLVVVGLLWVMIFVAESLCARVRTVQTVREFDQQLRKSQLMVTLFYEGVAKRDGKAGQDKLRPFFSMYESVSGKKLYDDADVVFVRINIKNPAVNELIRRYELREYPSFMICINGKPVVNKHGELVRLFGMVSKDELQRFINMHCMNDIKTIVTQKENNRKERVVRAQEESDPYFYPAVYYAPEYDFTWQKPLKYDDEGNEIG